MAVPAPQIDPALDEEKAHEHLFRPVRQPDGEVVVEQIPLTLDVLLDPQLEDQVSQSKPHQRQLNPLADTLERFLERQGDVGVFSDLLILWEQLGERNVSPDVFVVKGLRDRDAIDHSFDPVAEGVEPCLVIEVVSSSTRDMVKKDEESNPPLFARRKVEDLVLVYPPRPPTGGRLGLEVRRLAPSGDYRPNPPGPEGWIALRSVGLRIKVDAEGQRLIVEDGKTGERLLTAVEEEAARRAAQRRAEQEALRAEQEASRAEQEASRAEQEATARQQAESRAEQEAQRAEQEAQRADQEAAARQQAEAELERLKAQLGHSQDES